ncbi:MAG: MotA/TolQ/ExbB proton channel family protein [Arcicella sp.]|nr:MotA/TolQ/ExbB proton channel family protein [Arcicella sp.]
MEWIIVFILVGLQFYICRKAYRHIQNFKSLIPEEGALYLRKIAIPLQAIRELPPLRIIQNAYVYLLDESNFIKSNPNNQNSFKKSTQATYLILQKSQGTLTEDSERIIGGINVYLLRNQGAASDFNLIKDIVERNSDALEEDINLLAPMPLYLGLMGTMLGIVIGLWNIDDLSAVFNEASIGNSINVLLSGVKTAMIASLSGLFMTVLTGWLFKNAKSQVERNKNHFYTMIQSELLPVLNKSVYSSLFDLQRGFADFAQSFKEQIQSLSSVIGGNSKALLAQERIFEHLKDVNIAEFAQANVAILQQLQVTTKDLAKFNVYIQNLEGFVTQSKQIIERTEGLAAVADNLNQNFEASNQLFTFLSNHFAELDKHRLLLENSISKTDDRLSKIFDEFAEHLKDKIRKIEQISIQEENLMRTALSENRNNLGKLQFLEPLKNDFNTYSKEYVTRHKEIQQNINMLNENVVQLVHLQKSTLEKLNNNIIQNTYKWLFKSRNSNE